MLKDILKNKMGIRATNKTKEQEELMPFNLKGKLTIIAEKDGEVFHYDEGSNVVTIWAKHATMHLLTSETYSTHGNIVEPVESEIVYSSRSILDADHQDGLLNADGSLISGDQYFGDNIDYYDSGNGFHSHLNRPANLNIDGSVGDTANGFIFPFFPTKMLFGTGVEYANWDAVRAAGRDGAATDITSYVHPKNGGWDQSTFDDKIGNAVNYYSNAWDQGTKELIKARTVNDVYSGVVSGATPSEEDFGIPGAIKDAEYRQSTETSKLETIDGKQFATGAYRGVGRPSYIYCTRNRFMKEGAEVRLQTGSTTGTEDLESKITFTVVMPEQPTGEFYPYNGYTLKIAGLFADARMLLGNKAPIDDYTTAPTETDLTENEYSNYKKMPGGIMWAKRKIAPIYKSHDVKITAQWTIYLP